MSDGSNRDKPSWDNCQALLFDKDGTIINFKLMWLGWCREVIRELGAAYPAGTVEKSLSAWGVDLAFGRIDPDGFLAIGSTADLLDSLVSRLLNEGCSAVGLREVVTGAIYSAYRAVEEKKLIRPIEGVVEAVRELHKRGYLLAVVTTDDSDKAARNLEIIELEDCFDTVLGCDLVKSCKPAPDLVLEACSRLGINPSEAAVIGDTTADMLMGRAAGAACCIGVASGVTAPEVLAASADIVLKSAADMIDKPQPLPGGNQ